MTLAEYLWKATDSMLYTAGDGSDDGPFRVAVNEGNPRLAVMTGENASGKSVLAQIVASYARDEKVLPVSVSIRERTGAGGDQMRKVFMFGDDGEQSTGATSVKTTQMAFRNLDRDDSERAMLILDEPEMGLSEGYTAAFGQLIGQLSMEIPASSPGVLIVTHSRPLVRGIMSEVSDLPTHVATAATEDAEPIADLERWISTPETRTVEDLLALPGQGLDRWKAINKLVSSRR